MDPARTISKAVRAACSAILGGLLGGASAGSVLSGGLRDLVERFKQNGQGQAADSWVKTGPNQQLGPDQLEQAIGPDVLNTLSQQTGLSREELLSRLTRELPDSGGQIYAGGPAADRRRGGAADLVTELGSMTKSWAPCRAIATRPAREKVLPQRSLRSSLEQHERGESLRQCCVRARRYQKIGLSIGRGRAIAGACERPGDSDSRFNATRCLARSLFGPADDWPWRAEAHLTSGHVAHGVVNE